MKEGVVEKYIHNKTRNEYTVEGEALNCTNAQDGQIVVLYRNKNGQLFVREKNEFLQKFTLKKD